MKGQIKIPKKLFFVIIFILMLIIASIFLLLHTSGVQNNNPLSASPTPITDAITPYIQDSFLDSFIEKETLPTDSPLTSEEKALKDALPQVFSNRDPKNFGTLLVTSEPDNARIVLDANLDESHHAPIERDLPSNFTPFKLTTMPEGYYTLIADKDTYVPLWITIRVERNKVTRLHVHLNPANVTD